MSWDNRFLAMADMVATWSKDPSTGVGAVIVDQKNRIVSVGFNGFPRGVSDDYAITRDEKLRRTIHAEENALLFAGRSVENCTIYVTHPPCARCAAKIIQAGIRRVVARKPTAEFAERWLEESESAAAMFDEAGLFSPDAPTNLTKLNTHDLNVQTLGASAFYSEGMK